jgi:transposase
MLILADMPIAKTAGLLRCNEKSLVKVMRYWVNKAVDSMELKDVALLSIDETSFKRGHKYVTLIIDAAKRRVLDVEEGRDKETVKRFANKLLAKGGDPEQVTAVTSDMSKAFLPAIAEHFPNAKNVIDKKELFMGRRLFMVPQAKLSREQNVKLAEMSKRYPQTGRAYRIVASFDDFYASQTMEEANRNFDSLYSWMRRCRLEPMKEAAQTLKRYKDKILAYFKDRITNAICEGINSMIQATKRKARGFRTVEGYATMIYLVAGKLELAVPNPF